MNKQPAAGAALAGLVTALVVSVLSFGFICLALGSMFSNVDSRLMLTVKDTFSGLKEIRDVLNSTASYLAIANPPGVDHVPFPPGLVLSKVRGNAPIKKGESFGTIRSDDGH
jgi:hypothetical protein